MSSFADLNSAGARGITFEQATNDIKLSGDIRQIGEVSAMVAVTDGLLQYNGKKKYAKDIYDDIYYPKTPREQSAFNRSMANKTSGLKEGETKRIIVYTADNVYLITADGYMSGNIEQCISLNGSQKVINNYVQEWLNSDTSDEGFNILLETYGDESGGFDSFSLDVRDRRDENRNASVDSKKSYSRRAENTGAGFKDSEISKGKVTVASGVKLSKGEKAILSKIAKDSGVAVVVERFSGTDLASKGFYSGGVVHLNADRLSEGGFTYTGIHEVAHHLKAVNTEGYKAIESFVNNYYKEKGADLDSEVAKTQAYYKSKGVELTTEEAMEEIVCNTLSDIATDEDALSAFLGLDSKSQNKFIEVIKTLVRKLKEWANKFLKNTEYHSIVMNDADTLLSLAKQLRAELTKSKQKNNTADSGGAQYSFDKSVDSKMQKQDNKAITKNGGNDYGGENTKLLERREISAVGGNYDPVWEQSESAQQIFRYLGIFRANKTQEKTGVGETDSRWLAPNAFQQQIEKGFATGILRDLRGVKLSGRDVIGRTLSKELLNNLKDTIFKDENGNVLSLYHWTPNVFNVFRYGDIGFHFGTVLASHERYVMLKEENAKEGKNTPIGIYKEVYLNISNPIHMPDLGQWTAYDIAVFLEENGYISEMQYDRLSITEGFDDLSYDNPAINEVRKILTNHGYDGIVYYNESEDNQSISAIALYPEQVIMVTDNGMPVKSEKSSFGEIDEEYLSAVESGDMDTAQRFVDEAAEEAMKNSKIRDENGKLAKVYHGTESDDFYEFDKARRGQTDTVSGKDNKKGGLFETPNIIILSYKTQICQCK